MREKICCPNCAHINDACAKTCENCHADLVSGYQQTQEIKPKKKKSKGYER